jgi:hypothetical protein
VKEVGHHGGFLHRFVLDLPCWRDNRLVVDHINHDRLDNRRANLRAVANVLNLANSGANKTAVYSQFKGVTYDQRRRRWIAQITIEYNGRKLGQFATEEQAALAYNLAAVEAWGEHAQLNDIGPGVSLPAKRIFTSRHRGVSWIARNQRFRASIRVDGKLRHLGEFVLEDEAALAYNIAAAEALGERARLNVVDSAVTLPPKRKPTSPYRGVSRTTGSDRYQSTIRVDGKLRHLGRFDSEAEAALAYNAAALEALGDKARLNDVEAP